MVRAFARLLILLVLAAPLAASAEEVPPPIDPERVARLLLSKERSERDRGRALLLRRIGEGGDVRGFLERMTEAQARIANVPTPGVPRAAPRAPAQRDLGEDDVTPAAPTRPTQKETVPTAESKAPPGKAKKTRPAAPAHVLVLTAGENELLAHLEGDARQDLGRGRALVLRGTRAEALLKAAQAVPEARRFAEGWKKIGTAPLRVVEPERVRYRRDVRPTKKGAWALASGELERGLSVDLSLEQGQIRVVARHAEIPMPMPVTRVRPTKDVEPVEIDRPEWRVVANEARTAFREDVFAVLLPGVAPKRVVVVALHTSDAAARLSQRPQALPGR